jgi:hypothetical protein
MNDLLGRDLMRTYLNTTEYTRDIPHQHMSIFHRRDESSRLRHERFLVQLQYREELLHTGTRQCMQVQQFIGVSPFKRYPFSSVLLAHQAFETLFLGRSMGVVTYSSPDLQRDDTAIAYRSDNGTWDQQLLDRASHDTRA